MNHLFHLTVTTFLIFSGFNKALASDNYDIVLMPGKSITIVPDKAVTVLCDTPKLPACVVKLVRGDTEVGTYEIWAGENLLGSVSNLGLFAAHERMRYRLSDMRRSKLCY